MSAVSCKQAKSHCSNACQNGLLSERRWANKIFWKLTEPFANNMWMMTIWQVFESLLWSFAFLCCFLFVVVGVLSRFSVFCRDFRCVKKLRALYWRHNNWISWHVVCGFCLCGADFWVHLSSRFPHALYTFTFQGPLANSFRRSTELCKPKVNFSQLFSLTQLTTFNSNLKN
jgi:hypothetical protein